MAAAQQEVGIPGQLAPHAALDGSRGRQAQTRAALHRLFRQRALPAQRRDQRREVHLDVGLEVAHVEARVRRGRLAIHHGPPAEPLGVPVGDAEHLFEMVHEGIGRRRDAEEQNPRVSFAEVGEDALRSEGVRVIDREQAPFPGRRQRAAHNRGVDRVGVRRLPGLARSQLPNTPTALGELAGSKSSPRQ